MLAFADIEYNGLAIDSKKWKALKKTNINTAESLLFNLDLLLIEHPKLTKFVSKYVQSDLFVEIEDLRKVDVKWTSPKQSLEVFKTIIPDLDDVNGKNMYKHRFNHEIIDTYIQYKESMKLCTS